MANLRDLKNRIGSVKNTRQTTRAMKLVSAAKLRRSQESIVNNRPYAKKVGEMIHLVSSMSATPISSKLIVDPTVAPKGQPRVLLILVTSDRGLCGGFNSSVVKHSLAWIEENRSRCAAIDVGCVGKKAKELIAVRGVEAGYYREFGRGVTFGDAREVSDRAIQEFLDDRYDEIHFTYSEFKNAMVQGVVVEQFLPVGGEAVQLAEKSDHADTDASEKNVELYLVKPGHQEVLERLLSKHFSIQAYRILLESQASEHGARMVAMENATKNAGEMIHKLTLSYNRERQAGITGELLEIIAGAESQNN